VSRKSIIKPRALAYSLLSGSMWLIAALMLAILTWVALQRAGVSFSSTGQSAAVPLEVQLPPQELSVALPEYNPESLPGSVVRLTSLHTTIPTRARADLTYYEVQAGDSVTGIAKQFNIKPETVLWANQELLQDNPNMLSIGQNLKIPATNGVIYKWKKSDSLENIAYKFKADVQDILTWPSNRLDLLNPQIEAGTYVMIPGGSRELIQFVVPTIWRANSGATKSINAACDTSNGSAYGTGSFGWPADNRSLSGNDFWSGHLGIDIAAATGAPIYASDSGVVVYAASISGGYGLMVMIDHGNGFHTLYAHNSQIVARCGSNVAKGQVIAYAGSTGNSTGPHLHFEIRYNGAFVNPWDYLY
jgi:murein DD-endopeptidase MepM/ murein hydrolase activator NlpD